MVPSDVDPQISLSRISALVFSDPEITISKSAWKIQIKQKIYKILTSISVITLISSLRGCRHCHFSHKQANDYRKQNNSKSVLIQTLDLGKKHTQNHYRFNRNDTNLELKEARFGEKLKRIEEEKSKFGSVLIESKRIRTRSGLVWSKESKRRGEDTINPTIFAAGRD